MKRTSDDHGDGANSQGFFERTETEQAERTKTKIPSKALNLPCWEFMFCLSIKE